MRRGAFRAVAVVWKSHFSGTSGVLWERSRSFVSTLPRAAFAAPAEVTMWPVKPKALTVWSFPGKSITPGLNIAGQTGLNEGHRDGMPARFPKTRLRRQTIRWAVFVRFLILINENFP